MEKNITAKYKIDDHGRVLNISTGKYLKPHKGNHGYLTVSIDRKTTLLHRLIASAFIPNPEGKRTINHRDGNKLNNSIDNLEWATDSENNLHAVRVLGRKPPIPYSKNPHLPNKLKKQLLQMDLNGNIVKVWDSLSSASRSLSISKGNIYRVCAGRYSMAAGYKWAYKTQINKH
jgi:hypothetical protein